MNYLTFAVLIFLIIPAGLEHHERVLAAIQDNGCSSHKNGVIEQKQRIHTYNLNSLEQSK